MNTDKVEGMARNVVGKAQEGLGNLAGDSNNQAEGMARQVAGRAQETYGDVKDSAQDALRQVGSAVEKQPLLALLVAGAVGFALGSLLTSSVPSRRW
jgi:uncharacterized protein YjbJ (UPF0337 family)